MKYRFDPFSGRLVAVPEKVIEKTRVEVQGGGADLSDYYNKQQVDTLVAAAGAVDSVNGQTGAVVLDTDDIAEGTNQYFTNERVDDRTANLIQNGTGISWSYDDALGTLTPTVAPTAASINTALDTEWTDDTSVTITDLFGGTVSLGTGGEVRLRYKRIGRTITMQVYFEVGASPTFGNGGPWKLETAQLPAAAKQLVAPSGYTYTVASAFGFYSSGTNAMMEGIKPAIAKTGAGGTLVFVVDPGDGGLGNLFYPGNPIPVLEGDNYQGQITYEADSAA